MGIAAVLTRRPFGKEIGIILSRWPSGMEIASVLNVCAGEWGVERAAKSSSWYM